MVLEHRRPVELRSEEAIRWDIKEHQRGSKKSCDVYNQHCSDECSLRSFLNWPKGIPLHDPQSFKALGDDFKDLRESFVDAVYKMEIQVSAGPSPSVSSIWGLGKLVEPVHSASGSGNSYGVVPAKTVSWRHSAQSTAADPDTSSSISWLCVPDGTSFEALGDEIRRIGGYDPHVYPPLVRGLRTRRLGRVGKMTMEVDQLGNYLPAVMDEIAKASHNGPICVEDSATGGLKVAKDIFTEKISDNSSLQTVVGGLYRGYKQYVRDDPSSGEKVSWKRTFGVTL